MLGNTTETRLRPDVDARCSAFACRRRELAHERHDQRDVDGLPKIRVEPTQSVPLGLGHACDRDEADSRVARILSHLAGEILAALRSPDNRSVTTTSAGCSASDCNAAWADEKPRNRMPSRMKSTRMSCRMSGSSFDHDDVRMSARLRRSVRHRGVVSDGRVWNAGCASEPRARVHPWPGPGDADTKRRSGGRPACRRRRPLTREPALHFGSRLSALRALLLMRPLLRTAR